MQSSGFCPAHKTLPGLMVLPTWQILRIHPGFSLFLLAINRIKRGLLQPSFFALKQFIQTNFGCL